MKFETELDRILFQCPADEEIGSVSDLGWYGLYLDINLEDALRYSEESGEELTEDDRQLARECPYCILLEDSDGFVWSEYYRTKEEVMEQWGAIQAEYERYYAEEDEEEEEEEEKKE